MLPIHTFYHVCAEIWTCITLFWEEQLACYLPQPLLSSKLSHDKLYAISHVTVGQFSNIHCIRFFGPLVSTVSSWLCNIKVSCNAKQWTEHFLGKVYRLLSLIATNSDLPLPDSSIWTTRFRSATCGSIALLSNSSMSFSMLPTQGLTAHLHSSAASTAYLEYRYSNNPPKLIVALLTEI